MLKVDSQLNERGDGTCAPTILVTDETGDSCPLIFPEDMTIEDGKDCLNLVEMMVLSNYTTVAQVRRMAYGK